jgi:hypothetical protein
MSLPLLHQTAKIVQALFVQKGWGTDPNASPLGPWPVARGKELPSPDSTMTIYTTGGTDDGRSMIDGERFRHLAVQVRFRAQTDDDVCLKGEEVKRLMDEDCYQESVTVGAAVYFVQCFANVGDLLPLGDESPTSKRRLVTLNARVSLRRDS